jgi:hypothetical protein
MAKGNRTTSKQRALVVAEPPAEAPTPRHVLLAPNVEKRPNGLCMQGVYAKDIAGLLRLCAESIYKELVAIGKNHPGAPCATLAGRNRSYRLSRGPNPNDGRGDRK